MSTETKGNNNSIYFSIVQGEFVTPVSETHPEARKRTWEAGGRKGVKIERVVRALTGRITGVNFHDGEHEGKKFTSLNIVLDENDQGKTPVISTSVESRYAQDILKKLPNVELEEEVQFKPFDFETEEGKKKTGVAIYQRDGTGQFNKKVNSFFHKKVGEKWVAVNGFPEPAADTSTSDDWKIYYLQTRKFLVSYVKDKVAPKLAGEKVEQPKIEYPDEEINPEDIPFD